MFNLSERVKLSKKRKRIGRGGSRGGTSGKGTKGQKARSGAGRKLRPGFEGGQMPLHRRMPRRGFTNGRFKVEFELVKLGQLEDYFDNGTTVTKELLFERGILKNTNVLVKVLADGEFSKKFIVTVDACSASALQKIKACGGEVSLIKGA